MNKIEELIQQYCPNVVEYVELGEIVNISTGKLNANEMFLKGNYPYSTSNNPTDYLKKVRKRDNLLGDYIGKNCPQVDMITETGKQRKTLAANTAQLFRIIQSIPSKKAEPFKPWLAEVAKQY